jgi:hypothetical protein
LWLKAIAGGDEVEPLPLEVSIPAETVEKPLLKTSFSA